MWFVGYGDLRISGGGSSGRLQFRLDDGTWGYVCSRGFDSDAARVACRQLGYASGTDYYRYRKVNNIVSICNVGLVEYLEHTH